MRQNISLFSQITLRPSKTSFFNAHQKRSCPYGRPTEAMKIIDFSIFMRNVKKNQHGYLLLLTQIRFKETQIQLNYHVKANFDKITLKWLAPKGDV